VTATGTASVQRDAARFTRDALENALDAGAWVWSRRISLLLDELVVRGEHDA
jgi:hypothetical protein